MLKFANPFFITILVILLLIIVNRILFYMTYEPFYIAILLCILALAVCCVIFRLFFIFKKSKLQKQS
ncbi:hypothetical protein DEX24_05675 [Kurthia sibirica]|uniref:Uncharacterized protein n=1 Tax=Kurthia sibirica TaxID=202750 RepID=A0A2U3ANA9_9BACL|nr:hypothetical protein DEX24_05675 [Kurthia sibirica]